MDDCMFLIDGWERKDGGKQRECFLTELIRKKIEDISRLWIEWAGLLERFGIKRSEHNGQGKGLNRSSPLVTVLALD